MQAPKNIEEIYQEINNFAQSAEERSLIFRIPYITDLFAKIRGIHRFGEKEIYHLGDIIPKNRPALEMDCDLRIGGDLIFFDSKRTNKLRGKAAATGYTELPNGIIMQWGIDTRNSDGEYTLVFPTPFQNACFSVVINRQATGATSPMSAVNITKTGFGVDRENGISGDQTINYIAIGN